MALPISQFAAQFQDPMRVGVAQAITETGLFFRILNFIPVDGFTYNYGEETNIGGVAYRSLNEAYPDTAVGIVNPREERMPIFGGVVNTDIAMADKQGGAARANEIARKMKASALFFDTEVIKGDDATNPKAIRGLYKRLTGDQVIEAGDNGATLTLAMVDDLIDRVYGKNEQKVLVMNKFCRRTMKQLLVAAAGGAAVADVGGSLTSYDGVRIEVLDEDARLDPVLDFDETMGSSNVTTSILCVHPGSTTDKDGLQGLIGGQLAKHYANGPRGVFFEDVIETNAGIALFNGRCAARLKGIKKA